jgi:hypothetical protein
MSDWLVIVLGCLLLVGGIVFAFSVCMAAKLGDEKHDQCTWRESNTTTTTCHTCPRCGHFLPAPLPDRQGRGES